MSSSSSAFPTRTQKIQGRYGFAQVADSLCLIQCQYIFLSTFALSMYIVITCPSRSRIFSGSSNVSSAYLRMCHFFTISAKRSSPPPLSIIFLHIASYIRVLVLLRNNLHYFWQICVTSNRRQHRQRAGVLGFTPCSLMPPRTGHWYCLRFARGHGTLRSTQRSVLSGYWFLQTQ